jgi:hypothetical protein
MNKNKDEQNIFNCFPDGYNPYDAFCWGNPNTKHKENITICKGLLLLQNDADFCMLALPVGRPVVASIIYRIYTLAFFTNLY